MYQRNFLSHCKCNSDNCTCSIPDRDDTTFDIAFKLPTIQTKGSSMSSIDNVLKILETLSPAQRKEIAVKLTAMNAAGSAAAAERLRSTRLNEALQNPDNEVTVRTALRQLNQLGLDFEKVCASANTHELDKAMSENGRKSEQRYELKAMLAKLSAIA
jgi:hypothetical protein